MSRTSLSARVAWLLGISTVLILGIAAILMDRMVDTEMAQRLDDNLLSQAHTLADFASPGSTGTIAEFAGRPQERQLAERTAAAYAVQCASGEQLHSAPPPPQYPSRWLTDTAEEPEFADLDANGQTWRTLRLRFTARAVTGSNEGASAPAGADAGAASDTCSIVLMQPRTELDDTLIAIDSILLFTPMAALLAVLALSPLLVRRGLKPLATLAEEMRHVGPQAVGQRLRSSGTRELEPLVARFNEVLIRMDEGVQRERQFAGALAHETRTRLAELRALVEVERRFPSGRSAAELLDDVGSIGGELESIVSGLLLLTRLEAGIESVQLDRIDLDAHLTRQLKRIATTLQQRNLRVDTWHSSDDATLVADPSLLDLILGNLLTNAGTYTPVGGVIHIHRERNALVISNPAPDLQSDDVEKFAQRYWSKHHGTGGHTGLGLTLAGAAAAAMHLRLDFSLDADQRLRACLHWPDSARATQDIGSKAAG